MSRIDLIKLRRGTSATWVENNPILAIGEPGYETDTGQVKIGDGAAPWNALNYIALNNKADLVDGKVPAAQLPTSDGISEGVGNLYFADGRVRSAVLTGLSVAANAVIVAADTILQALGKLQAQMNAVRNSNGLIKSNGSGTISAATAKTDYWDTTNFVGDAGSGGSKGLVPAPSAGDAAAGKFLKASGVFAAPEFGRESTSWPASPVLWEVVWRRDLDALFVRMPNNGNPCWVEI